MEDTSILYNFRKMQWASNCVHNTTTKYYTDFNRNRSLTLLQQQYLVIRVSLKLTWPALNLHVNCLSVIKKKIYLSSIPWVLGAILNFPGFQGPTLGLEPSFHLKKVPSPTSWWVAVATSIFQIIHTWSFTHVS